MPDVVNISNSNVQMTQIHLLRIATTGQIMLLQATDKNDVYHCDRVIDLSVCLSIHPSSC